MSQQPNPGMLLKVDEPHRDRLFDKYAGALLGAAIADALGWITEFRRSKDELAKLGLSRVENFITWAKPTGGRFRPYLDYVSEGEYSDDTQLSLCTARSIKGDGRFDPARFTEELRAWLDYARGAGVAITAAARNLRERKAASWDNNFGAAGVRTGRRGYLEAGGNGAAMRVAPIGMANRLDSELTKIAVWQNAVATHGHPRAIVGALTIAEAVRELSSTTHLTNIEFLEHLCSFVQLLETPAQMSEWVNQWNQRSGRIFNQDFEATKSEMVSMLRLASDTKTPYRELLVRLGCFTPATKGSGTGTVAAAIAAFLREPRDYARGTLGIVNTLGIDTDTIAAMYGSMVGIRLGSTAIPDRWAVKMQDYDYFLSVAATLVDIALREAQENELKVDVEMVRRRETDNVLEVTRLRTVSKSQRIYHHLLGTGWVQAVNEQEVRGGRILLADVALDSGQSVKFKSFRSLASPLQVKAKAPTRKAVRTRRPPIESQQFRFHDTPPRS